MREIVTVQVGCGGNAIGEEFFKIISNEHGLDCNGEYCGTNPLQLERINVFFEERLKNYCIRAIAVDTDPKSIEHLSKGKLGELYYRGNLVKGTSGSGHNFAKGYYEHGKQLIGPVMNSIRLQCESSDSVQGVQVIQTLGGGTGSGLSSLIWEQMADEYKDNITQTVSIIPSPKLSSVVVEPYNCMLTFPHLLEHTQLTFCIDNESLYNICHRIKLKTKSFDDTNHLTAHVLSGVTTSLRFPGHLNTALRKLYVNMVPFPNLHFLVPSFSPLTACKTRQQLTTTDMVMQLFNANNMFATIDLEKNKLLTVATIFRGVKSEKDEVYDMLHEIKEEHPKSFTDWIPNNVKTEFCEVPPMGLTKSATFIGNTTGITKLFTRVHNQFVTMYNNKAHLHWYTEQGMEEGQFEECNQKLYDFLEECHSQSKEMPPTTDDMTFKSKRKCKEI